MKRKLPTCRRPILALNTVIPIFPGLGLLAAIVGIVTKDKFVSFSVGFVPHILNWLMYLSLSVLGSATVYSSIEEMALGLFTLLAAGSDLGLLGLGGVFYGSFHEKGSGRLARLSLATFLSGFLHWLFVVWGWPGWGATVPGLSRTLGFWRPEIQKAFVLIQSRVAIARLS